MRRIDRSAFIAGGLLLLVVGVSPAQMSSGGFTGSSGSSSGGFTGSSGSSSGGFTGSSGSSSGGFTGSSGSSSGGFTGSAGSTSRSGSGGIGTNNVGSTGPFGRFYGTPLASRLATQNASGKFAITQPTYPASYTGSFGTPLYDAATLARAATQGTTGLGTTGTQGSVTTATFGGASSAGMRRAPGYVTEPVFDMPVRPSLETIRPDLQGVVARATRLPSRDRIQVLADGETVVLRGQVRDERERRLAEAMIRLSPGVRTVRNELEHDNKPPAK